jgi:mono/diheme cytochrome c family protein
MRWALLLILLSTGFVLAACGGDAGTDGESPSPAPAGDGAMEATPTTGDGAATPGRTADAATPSDTAAIDEATLALGRTAYSQGSCIMCHGPNGGGARFGPDLTDDRWDHGDGSVASIRQLLVEGIAKGDFVNREYPMPMPPVTNLITDEAKIDALAKYVWSMSNQAGE